MQHRGFTLLSGLVYSGLVYSASLLAQPPALTMAFNDRPPYHYQVDAQSIPQGTMADILVHVLADANLPVDFVPMPGHRIMAETKKAWPFCSFTWFKTPERSQFAKFTLPLGHEAPYVLVTHRYNEKKFQRYSRLVEVLQDPSVSLGSKAPTSYGGYIDQLLQSNSNRARLVMIPTSQQKIIQQLDNGRFDAVILSPEEAPGLFQNASVNFSLYTSINYQDIPPGEPRRIMCSKAVSDQTIERLNNAIRKRVPASTRN